MRYPTQFDPLPLRLVHDVLMMASNGGFVRPVLAFVDTGFGVRCYGC
jgi:hypothetical protein